MTKLNEGLRANDLDYLLMPIVSIDEYESKIDDRKAVVIGFYVTDSDPASELATFIEKGTVSVLDTDVSPAPTEDGYYLVFVEMDRDDKLPGLVIKLIDSINRLTNVSKWQFSPYHSKKDENYDLTIEELKKHVNCDPDSIEVRDEDGDEEPDQTTEQIAGFMRNSMLESFKIDNDIMTVKGVTGEHSFRIAMFGDGEPDLQLKVPMIGESQLGLSSRLQSMLGGEYQVYETDTDLLVLSDDKHLLLTVID